MSLVIPFDEIFNEVGLLAKAFHWERVELGKVASILNGFPLKSTLFSNKEGFPIIRIRDLKNNSTETFYLGDFPEQYIIEDGDLLIGMDGDFICYEWTGGEAVLNQRVCKLIANDKFVLKRFLYYAINGYLDAIHKVTSSVTVKHLSSLDILKIPFPLPPLEEQHRIVQKLDALLVKVDSSKARLDKIPSILKSFRQSVLAAAVSGELSQGDYNEWNKAILSEVIIGKPKNGYSAKPVKYETKYKVLTLTATTSGTFNPSYFKYFDEEVEEGAPFWLQPNDILIQRGNTIEYVGVPAIYDGKPNEFVYPDLMMRLRANEDIILTKFLYLVLSSESSRNYLRKRATGTAGNMPKINQPTLMSLPLRFPSISEQKEIVRKVDELFHFADSIEARYQKAKTWFDKISQAILAKAFRGELVEQDENDEPASVLLEKTKMEKEGLVAKDKKPVSKKGRNTLAM